MHTSPPTISRIFADRYRREATRLEKLHSNHLSPGAKTWDGAIRALEAKLRKLGPIQRTAAIKKVAAYLKDTQREGMHFILGLYGTKRSAILSFATINFGEHPLAGIDEDGVSILRHTIAVRRDGTGWAMGNQNLAYISRHAMQRLHERSQDNLSIEHATKIFKCVGMLGHLVAASDSVKHLDSAMSLHVEELMAVGMIRNAVGTMQDNDDRKISCVFFEVRTFLTVAEMIGNRNRVAMLKQGNIAMDILHRWIGGGRKQDITGLVDEIPSLPAPDDDFIMQNAVKTMIGA